MNKLKPDGRVFIAFDGVAPLAKLDQQRNRRYMTAFQASLDSNSGTSASGSASMKWNTSAITPGTDFMTLLGTTIKTRFNKPAEFGLQQIIVSASDDAGEGEHKIYEYIRNDPLYHKDTCTVIYGLDADLIMLTLNHLHISENMFLFRETPEFIKSIDKTLNPNEMYVLDIPLFAKSIIAEMTKVQAVQAPALASEAQVLAMHSSPLTKDVLFDYIFMCFFLGNDFLPHFPALNIRTSGIQRLIDTYNHIFAGKKESLTKNREIIWKNVRLFITSLAENELDYIKTEYIQREKMSKQSMYSNFNKNNNDKNKPAEDENLRLPTKERSLELYINPNEGGWESRYYNCLFNIRIDDDRRQEICTNYLEGLEWTMKYYSTGCADWRWSYNYYYPPLLSDLIKYVPYFDKTFIPAKPKNPVSPLVQLSYVLPPVSMDLLPPKLKEALVKEEPDWYVGNYNFLWAFCTFFWEAHVDLPHIALDRLEQIVAKTMK
jgi:5'-3' exonuclease